MDQQVNVIGSHSSQLAVSLCNSVNRSSSTRKIQVLRCQIQFTKWLMRALSGVHIHCIYLEIHV